MLKFLLLLQIVAGNGLSNPSGVGGSAASTGLSFPAGVAVDFIGNVFILDEFEVWKVPPDGTITTVDIGTAGLPNGFGGSFPPLLKGIAVDAQGNLFISGGQGGVWKVSASGTSAMIVGQGNAGFSGDGGPAVSAQLNYPGGIATTIQALLAEAINTLFASATA